MPIKFDLGDYGQSIRMNDGGLLDAIGGISANRRKMRREDDSDQIVARNADLQEKRFGLDTDEYKSRTGETKRKNKQEAIAKYHGDIQMGADPKAAFARSGLADHGYTFDGADEEATQGPAQAGPQGPAPERRENALDAMKAPPLHGDTPVEPPPMKFDATAGNYGHADRPEAGEPTPRTPTRLPVQGRRMIYAKDESGNRLPFDPNVTQDERLNTAGFFAKLGAANPTLKTGSQVGEAVALAGGTVGQAGQAVSQFGAAEMRGDESEAARLARERENEKNRALRESLAAKSRAAAASRASKPKAPGAADYRLVETSIDNTAKMGEKEAAHLSSLRASINSLASGDQSIALPAAASEIVKITGALNATDKEQLIDSLAAVDDKWRSWVNKGLQGEVMSPAIQQAFLKGMRGVLLPFFEKKFQRTLGGVHDRLAYQDGPTASGARAAVDKVRAMAGDEPFTDAEYASWSGARTARRKGTDAPTSAGEAPAAPQVSAKAAAMIDALMAKRKAPK